MVTRRYEFYFLVAKQYFTNERSLSEGKNIHVLSCNNDHLHPLGPCSPI